MDLYGHAIYEGLSQSSEETSIHPVYWSLGKDTPTFFRYSRIMLYLYKYILLPVIFACRLRKYDIVHIVDQSYAYLVLLRYLFFVKTKFICTVHDLIPFYALSVNGKKVSLPYRLSIWACTKSQLIIFPSEYTMSKFNKLYESPHLRKLVCRHGVQMTFDLKNRHEEAIFPSPNEKLVVGFCLGEFYKNTQFSISICSELAERYDVHVCILGRQSPAIKKELEANGIVSVQFHSNLSEDEIYNYYKKLHLFLFPSKIEGLGQPLIEALKLGCPVYANEIPVFKEVTGYAYDLYPCRTPAEIWQFLQEYRSHSQNLKLIEALERYLWITFNKYYLELIKDL